MRNSIGGSLGPFQSKNWCSQWSRVPWNRISRSRPCLMPYLYVRQVPQSARTYAPFLHSAFSPSASCGNTIFPHRLRSYPARSSACFLNSLSWRRFKNSCTPFSKNRSLRIRKSKRSQRKGIKSILYWKNMPQDLNLIPKNQFLQLKTTL